jgi:hypothetical protein
MAKLMYDEENAVWHYGEATGKVELTECKNGCGQTVKHRQMAWGDCWDCTAGCGYSLYYSLGD